LRGPAERRVARRAGSVLRQRRRVRRRRAPDPHAGRRERDVAAHVAEVRAEIVHVGRADGERLWVRARVLRLRPRTPAGAGRAPTCRRPFSGPQRVEAMPQWPAAVTTSTLCATAYRIESSSVASAELEPSEML